jgi:hypothetical protein
VVLGAKFIVVLGAKTRGIRRTKLQKELEKLGLFNPLTI